MNIENTYVWNKPNQKLLKKVSNINFKDGTKEVTIEAENEEELLYSKLKSVNCLDEQGFESVEDFESLRPYYTDKYKRYKKF